MEGLILCVINIYLFPDTEEVLVSQASNCPCVNPLCYAWVHPCIIQSSASDSVQAVSRRTWKNVMDD